MDRRQTGKGKPIFRSMAVLLLLISGAALLAGPAGCRGRSEGRAEINIGLILPLSGDLAESGRSALQGAELLAGSVNRGGGLTLGGKRYTLALLAEDGGANPQAGVAAAQKLINQKGVVAIIGPLVSAAAVPVGRLAERAGIPMISPTSTNPETTAGKRFVFRTAFTDIFQGRVMARFCRQELRAREAAVLFDAAGLYNQTMARFFRQAFEEDGGKVTAFEFYTTGEKDFSPQMSRIFLADPDVLFLPNYRADLLDQGFLARELGLRSIMVGPDSWDTLLPRDWPALEGAYFSTLWAPNQADKRGSKFVEAFQKAYDRAPSAQAALTYDSLGLLVQAIKNAGRAEPESIRAGLAGIENYPGVGGSITFREGGDPLKSVAILKIDQGKASFHKEVEPAEES